MLDQHLLSSWSSVGQFVYDGLGVILVLGGEIQYTLSKKTSKESSTSYVQFIKHIVTQPGPSGDATKIEK